MGSGLVHDVHTDLGLVSFSKLVDVLVLALFQRHMKNLVHVKTNKQLIHPTAAVGKLVQLGFYSARLFLFTIHFMAQMSNPLLYAARKAFTT